MTPEDRAQSVLRFLKEYLSARETAQYTGQLSDWEGVKMAESFLGTALVALVTDGRKIDE